MFPVGQNETLWNLEREREREWDSLMVTLLAWMAQRLQSSKRPTMKASLASCSASSASAVHLYGSTETVLPISRTSRAKGSFLKSKSVVFW